MRGRGAARQRVRALDGRLPNFPDRDVALVWSEERGWAVAVETYSGEDLIVLARLGVDVLPAPRTVAEWVTRVFRDEHTDEPVQPRKVNAAANLGRRLAPYAVAAFTSTPRFA